MISFMIMIRKPYTAPPGFTLIEVMTAVTILAIMATFAFTVVFGAVKRSVRIDEENDLRTEALAIVNLMVDDLRGAYVKEGRVNFLGEDQFHSENPADRISLLTTATLPVDPEIPAGGVGEVEYDVLEGKGPSLVLVRREQAPAQSPYDEGGNSFEITDRVRSLNITYYDGQEWYDQWDSQNAGGHDEGKLPRQIRIELVLEDGDLSFTCHSSAAPVMAVGR